MSRRFAAALSTLLFLLCSAHPVPAFGRIAVGEQVADFCLPTPTGETLRLSEAAGTKATLILFWATWSPRSTEALADFQQLYAQHGPGELGVVAVNVDSEAAASAQRETVASAVERVGVAYPVVIDEDLFTFSELGVVAVPSLVLTDPARRVVALLDGYAPTTRFDFRERVLEIVSAARADEEPVPSGTASYQAKGAAAKYLQMGRLYLRKGRRRDALKFLAQAVAEDPEYTEACAALAELRERLGRHEEAGSIGARLACRRTNDSPSPLR